MRRLRIFAAFLVLGVALAAGLYLHRYEATETRHVAAGCAVRSLAGECLENSGCPAHDEKVQAHPGWAAPAAIVVVFAGLGLAGAIGVRCLR